MKNLLKIFQKPYDLLKDKKLRSGLLLGGILFCFIFLWIFEPYGLYQIEDLHQKLFIIGMYAIGAAVISVILSIIQDLIIKNYTLGNTILWIALHVGINYGNNS